MISKLGRLAIATLAIVGGWTIPAQAQKAVYLVRHAEKAGDAPNSPLTDQGTRRAQALARLLKDAGIKAIYTSDALRTQETARPLAERLGIRAEAVPGGDPDATFRRITTEHAGDVVLVVGHSDTVPMLLSKWASGAATTIGASEFDLIFVVVPIAPGEAGWSRFRYQPDPPPSDGSPSAAAPRAPAGREGRAPVVLKGHVYYAQADAADAAAPPPPGEGGPVQITVFDGFETTTVAAGRDRDFSVPLGRASDGMLLAVYATRVACQPQARAVTVGRAVADGRVEIDVPAISMRTQRRGNVGTLVGHAYVRTEGGRSQARRGIVRFDPQLPLTIEGPAGKFETKTGDDGAFSIELPPGPYTVTSARNFQTKVQVEAGKTTVAPIPSGDITY